MGSPGGGIGGSVTLAKTAQQNPFWQLFYFAIRQPPSLRRAPVTADTPIISTQPTNVVVALGGTATFKVVISNVTCLYQWLLNNQPRTDGNGISGSQTATLTITGVTAANTGIYSVMATNQAKVSFSVQSAGASLSAESASTTQRGLSAAADS